MSTPVQPLIEPPEVNFEAGAMAPITPAMSQDRSRKRSSSQSENSPNGSPTKKSRCTTSEFSSNSSFVGDAPHIEPPEAAIISKMFDDDPHQLLLRAVALALEHVGFEGASVTALEALCAEVDACMLQFSSHSFWPNT